MSGTTTDDMFGIKLIWPKHLYPEIPYFDHSLGPDLPALMNFNSSPEGRTLAARLPIGHRCLVYVTEVQRFIWAIEFIGTVADGEAAAKRHRIAPRDHRPFTVYRPIRFVARADPWHERGAPRQVVCARSGVDFAPTEGTSHVSLSPKEYGRIYAAIPWTTEFD